MIDAIETALRKIDFNVPEEVISTTFGKDSTRTVEASILDDVIVGMVLKDCNLAGGKTISIPLLSTYAEPTTDTRYGIFRIPPEARNNLSIIETHRIIVSPHSLNENFYGSVGNSIAVDRRLTGEQRLADLNYAASSLLLSKSNRNPDRANTPFPELLQGDLIKLTPPPQYSDDLVLICRTEYDKSLTGLNSSAILKFANLCVTATKWYCYKTLIIKINSGELEFGGDLDSLKNTIERWSDYDERYEEQILPLSKATAMDPARLRGLLKAAM